MDLIGAMGEVATRLRTIAGLRVFDYPVDEVRPPTAIVALPEITFDETYGRGTDRYAMPVLLVVGNAVDRAARNNLAPYVKGSGAKSVKATLEGYTPVAFDSIRVQSASFDVVTFGSVDYLTASFTLDILGSGA